MTREEFDRLQQDRPHEAATILGGVANQAKWIEAFEILDREASLGALRRTKRACGTRRPPPGAHCLPL